MKKFTSDWLSYQPRQKTEFSELEKISLKENYNQNLIRYDALAGELDRAGALSSRHSAIKAEMSQTAEYLSGLLSRIGLQSVTVEEAVFGFSLENSKVRKREIL